MKSVELNAVVNTLNILQEAGRVKPEHIPLIISALEDKTSCGAPLLDTDFEEAVVGVQAEYQEFFI